MPKGMEWPTTDISYSPPEVHSPIFWRFSKRIGEESDDWQGLRLIDRNIIRLRQFPWRWLHSSGAICVRVWFCDQTRVHAKP